MTDGLIETKVLLTDVSPFVTCLTARCTSHAYEKESIKDKKCTTRSYVLAISAVVCKSPPFPLLRKN